MAEDVARRICGFEKSEELPGTDAMFPGFVVIRAIPCSKCGDFSSSSKSFAGFEGGARSTLRGDRYVLRFVFIE